MSRHHGKNARLYVAIASSGLASPVPFINAWEINGTTDKEDVTAFGDTNKNYVVGLPDAQGTYGGFFDLATNQLYTASQDGVARKFYFYPDIVAAPGTYFFGEGFYDFSANWGVSAGAAISGSWAAASSIIKVLA